MNAVRLRYTAAAVVMAIGVMATVSGCVSTPAPETGEIHLTMTSVGTVLIDGKTVARSELPRLLKASGAEAGTPIVVAIPAKTPMTAVTALASQLASAGYRRVAFTRPRHVEAKADLAPPKRR